jgi:hypothetical protein|tara:strand:+ start:672 stop:857 length:186 start_codon:yes stop_codon:yes gene_type:complete
MAMMYGDIDKSREKRDDLNRIITNLTEVIDAWDVLDMGNAIHLEKLVKDALDSALKLKGDS